MIRDWVEAGFTARSAHQDGSCDDYFPYEGWWGGGVFPTGKRESYTMLGLSNPTALRFFEKTGDWLAHHHESGRLTNHQALIVLCLEIVSKAVADVKVGSSESATLRAGVVLSSEGWFME